MVMDEWIHLIMIEWYRQQYYIVDSEHWWLMNWIILIHFHFPLIIPIILFYSVQWTVQTRLWILLQWFDSNSTTIQEPISFYHSLTSIHWTVWFLPLEYSFVLLVPMQNLPLLHNSFEASSQWSMNSESILSSIQ